MTQAAQLHTFLQHDPQLQLPSYPWLSEAFQIVWEHGELALIMGGTSDVVLRGKAVRRLLPQLLPLLTGAHSLEDISQRLPEYSETIIKDAIQLLYMQGVLEHGKGQNSTLSKEQTRTFRSQLSYYSRYVDLTRVHHNRYSVLETLQESHIFIIGNEDLVKPLHSNLTQLGVGHSTWQPWLTPDENSQLNNTEILGASTDSGQIRTNISTWLAHNPEGLVILLTDEGHTELTLEINRTIVSQGGRFIRGYLQGSSAIVGPTVFGNESSCYQCATLQDSVYTTEPSDGQLGQELGIYQLSSLILNILTKLAPITSGDTQFSLNADTLAWEVRSIYKLVGCPTCGVEHTEQRDFALGSEHAENFPAWYHINTNERSYGIYPKGHQQHYSAKNAKAMQSAAKGYTNSTTFDLKSYANTLPQSSRTIFGHKPSLKAPINSLEQLSWVLLASAGRQIEDQTSGWVLGHRATPAGGNLASQTLYVINNSLSGLPVGLYHFNQHTGQLELRHEGNLRSQIDSCIGSQASALTNVPAIIIATIALGRLEAKYGYKAYRYGLYDGGALLESLHHASSVVGWDLKVSLDFDDQSLQTLLNIHTPHTETPLYVAYIQPCYPEGVAA